MLAEITRKRTLVQYTREKGMRRFLVLQFVFAALAPGQATHIGKHQIGETLDDWYSREPDQPNVSGGMVEYNIRKRLAPHRFGETFAEWMRLFGFSLDCTKGSYTYGLPSGSHLCKTLTTIAGSGQGVVDERDGLNAGFKFYNGLLLAFSDPGRTSFGGRSWHEQHVPTKDDELVIASNHRLYTYKFSDGKLSVVYIIPDATVLDYQQEVGFLTQLYGFPATTETNQLQNAMGAHWDRRQTAWVMPDGASILAVENKEFDGQDKLSAIVFMSKDARDKQATTAPNPYK
jgi:hypothetical protein